MFWLSTDSVGEIGGFRKITGAHYFCGMSFGIGERFHEPNQILFVYQFNEHPFVIQKPDDGLGSAEFVNEPLSRIDRPLPGTNDIKDNKHVNMALSPMNLH